MSMLGIMYQTAKCMEHFKALLVFTRSKHALKFSSCHGKLYHLET